LPAIQQHINVQTSSYTHDYGTPKKPYKTMQGNNVPKTVGSLANRKGSRSQSGARDFDEQAPGSNTADEVNSGNR
jgi:hypothetical protein